MKTEDFLDDLDIEVYELVTSNVAKVKADSIDDELANLPLKYSFYAGAYALAQNKLDEAKDKLLTTLSTSKEVVRSNYTGKYKLANTTLDSQVDSFPEVIDARKDITSMQLKVYLIKGILGALDIKNQMIIQISANRRGEIKTYNSI